MATILFNPLGPPFDFSAPGAASGPVTSITGVAPVQANGVSGVAQTGAVSISVTDSVVTYTPVVFGDSPYTVLVTDDYISVDSAGGPVTLNFPDTPVSKQKWIVKDRTGNSNANPITIRTPSLVKTFDGATSYTIDDMFEAVQILANPGGNYEIF